VIPAALGEILFCSHQDRTDGMDGIYVMHVDGSNVRLLSNTLGATDWMPTLSPDGTRIAFGSNRVDPEAFVGPDGTLMAIYLMNPDGSGQERVTNNKFSSYRPSWSPDGTQIVYAAFETGELFVMKADGSSQTRLTAGQSGHPSWSPSGKVIAFSGQEGRGTDALSEIGVVNVDGSGRRELTHDGQTNEKPSWSPDGTRIAFDSKRGGNTDIYVMDADGTHERRLTTDAAVDEWPAWSPDGGSIAFTHQSPGGSEIYVMKTDGSGETSVAKGQQAWCPSWR
jgi:TolB protein